MTDSNPSAEELRRQAVEQARRASAAQDPVVEGSHRRLARHYLKRAAEFEADQQRRSAGGASE